tara:strand:- start:49264 stop:49815 length:552 start_codon:yes stop_codon:yes gene_type:complete
MDFIFGILLGIYLLGAFNIMKNVNKTYKALIKPLDKYINSNISNFTFIERKNIMVKLNFDKEYYLILMLDTNSVNVFKNDELVLYNVKENKTKMKYLFDKLVNGFNDNIYRNITEVNGNVFSNNLLIKENKEKNININGKEYLNKSKWDIDNIHTPTIDDILDKINKTGVESLTKIELKILGK